MNAGGAIMTNGSAEIRNCLFLQNNVDWASSFGGGAIQFVGQNLIENCIFQECSAAAGGAVLAYKYSDLTFKNCTFNRNEALTGNGVGVTYGLSVVLENCIVANGTQGQGVIGGGITTLSHCNIFGNAGGDWVGDIAGQLGVDGNICENPLFVDGAHLDCHLRYDSPCRDAGDSSTGGFPDEDFEGDPRIAYGTIDMGFDEFYTHLYCTGQFHPGGTVKAEFVGLPGASPMGLFIGSGVLDPPFHHMWGDFYLMAPWFLIPFGVAIPGNGVLEIVTTIPATPAAPYEIFLQALIGLSSGSLTNLCLIEVR
ncbi:MAG: right-handed parallel beta-helix repeat-containing protein [Planctomycetota bacterium]